jgi:hypothetical protein
MCAPRVLGGNLSRVAPIVSDFELQTLQVTGMSAVQPQRDIRWLGIAVFHDHPRDENYRLRRHRQSVRLETTGRISQYAL